MVPRFSYVGLTNGSLRIVVQAQGGFMYRLDASPDLINWWPGATNFNQNSSIEFIEPAAGAPRYYRAVKLQ